MNEKRIFAPKPKNAILTIPNIITCFGFVFTGLYINAFLSGLSAGIVFLFLFFAGVSDAIDGISARLLRQATKLGEILDPVRDRALMLAILWNFWLDGDEYTRFFICVILYLEAAVFIFNIKIKEEGRDVSHIYCKIRQAGHLFCAALAVLGTITMEIASFAIMLFSVIALYGTMIGYFLLKEERRMVWTDSDW